MIHVPWSTVCCECKQNNVFVIEVKDFRIPSDKIQFILRFNVNFVQIWSLKYMRLLWAGTLEQKHLFDSFILLTKKVRNFWRVELCFHFVVISSSCPCLCGQIFGLDQRFSNFFFDDPILKVAHFFDPLFFS